MLGVFWGLRHCCTADTVSLTSLCVPLLCWGSLLVWGGGFGSTCATLLYAIQPNRICWESHIPVAFPAVCSVGRLIRL